MRRALSSDFKYLVSFYSSSFRLTPKYLQIAFANSSYSLYLGSSIVLLEKKLVLYYRVILFVKKDRSSNKEIAISSRTPISKDLNLSL